MKYYQDITLMPDAEASLGFLWQKVYQQVHIALVDNKIAENESAVAISLPLYGAKDMPLGNKLRLLSNDENLLKQLEIEKWLSRLTDYCHIKFIQSVPNTNQHVCFKRQSVKSEFKKAQSLAKHLGKSVEEVLKYRKEQGLSNKSKLPYIHMESQQKTTTGIKNKFKLFIAQKNCNAPVKGVFDCYGLSKTATVPWF